MDPTLVSIIALVVAVAISAYSIWRFSQKGEKITGEVVVSTMKESHVLATELAEVALTAAQAAEQLYISGKIGKSAKLDHAFDYVKRWFPDIDQETIITAIEAGVLVVNSIVNSASTVVPVKPTEEFRKEKGKVS